MLRLTTSILLFFAIQCGTVVRAQNVLFEDTFDTPQMPLSSHIPTSNLGTRTVDNGEWIWQEDDGGLMTSFVSLPDSPANVSIRTQVRALDVPDGDWVFLGIYGRNHPGPNGGNYYGGVGSNGTLSIGYVNPNIVVTDQQMFGLTTTLPVNLRLDIVDDQISLWGWNEGQPEPADPQLELIDSRFSTGGGAGLIFNPRQSSNNPRVAFDYFQVSVIPEPTSSLLAFLGGMVIVATIRRAPAKAR